ncbi:hypothetical protein ABXV18_24965 [Vibrio owensii]|uniref:hypothetical protein n=1 Tax=Vibrio owensii TaxID=696485 RepID=UPI00339120D1
MEITSMAIKKGIAMEVNASEVMSRLYRVGDRVQKHSVDVMRRYAARVERLAKLNVPVQDFHVEDSIVTQEKRSGMNRRIEITVGVDEGLLREYSGQDYDYSIWLHEADYNLSKLSEYKDSISRSEDPKAKVGNKYLENALNSVRNDAIAETRREVKRQIKG